MGMTNISIPFDEEKLSALDFSLSKEHSSAQQRMERALAELYEESVPAALREYIDSKNAPAPKPKRPSKTPASSRSPQPPKQQIHSPILKRQTKARCADGRR
jgi:hypothetical protein